MKIGAEDINHNVTLLIDDLLIWELSGEGDDTMRTMALGYISGLNDLAKQLKKVLAE